MSDIYLEHAHAFDFLTARSKAKTWLGEVQNRLGLAIDYQEGDGRDTATIKKSGVEAVATLTTDKIIFEAKLGLLAKALKGQIVSGIETGLKTHFG